MADRIPFVAYIKVTPERGNGKREEIRHSRERMAWSIYQDLVTAGAFGSGGDGDGITLAVPGGSVTLELIDNNSSVPSSVGYAGAVSPQFGESPDTVKIVGFITISDGTYTDTADSSPYRTVSIIHCSADNSNATPSTRVVTGPAGLIAGWKSTDGPTLQNNIAATLIKDMIESATSTGEIIGVEVKGVKYGRGGFSFNPA